jgi:hypothetical protein
MSKSKNSIRDNELITHIISRRTLLKAIMMAAAAPTGIALAADDPKRYKSGYGVVDNGVRRTLEYLSRIFRLENEWIPDFSFFDDGDEANSYAEDPIIGFRRPHVKIGKGAVAETMLVSQGDFGAALTGIFAHEFAHVYQLKAGYRAQLLAKDGIGSHRLVETHADFLAGWALPQAWWITKISDLRVAAEQFFALGDIQFEAQGHHGTSLQRQSIMASGYTWGLASPGDPDKAAERGLNVLSDLFPQWFRSV